MHRVTLVRILLTLNLLLADAGRFGELQVFQLPANEPQTYVLVRVIHEPERQEDPNILLLYRQSLQTTLDSPAASRTAREMSQADKSETNQEGSSQPLNIIDLVFRTRRKLSQKVPIPSMWLHPPPLNPSEDRTQAENSDSETPTDPSHQTVNEDADTSPTPVNLPDFFLELGHMLTQPLRNDKSNNRDSYDFGMIAKAPVIICPTGHNRDRLGKCRPIFRKRRGYAVRRVQLRQSQREAANVEIVPESLYQPSEHLEEDLPSTKLSLTFN